MWQNLTVHLVQCFSKFLQHLVARATTVPSNQIAEGFEFWSLIGSHSWHCCNQKLQELGKRCISSSLSSAVWQLWYMEQSVVLVEHKWNVGVTCPHANWPMMSLHTHAVRTYCISRSDRLVLIHIIQDRCLKHIHTYRNEMEQHKIKILTTFTRNTFLLFNTSISFALVSCSSNKRSHPSINLILKTSCAVSESPNLKSPILRNSQFAK